MKNKNSTIPSMLSALCKKAPSKTAMFLNNGNKISYEDMMWDVSMTSRALKEQGITKSSKVALFMDNSPQTVVSFLAITKMGAVAVLLRNDFSKEQIASILEEAGPDAVFVSENKMKYLPKIKDMAVLALDDNRVLSSVSRQVSNSITEVKEKDNAVILYGCQNGQIFRKEYTQEGFADMSSECKKSNTSGPVNTIIDAVKTFIAPVLNGVTVMTAI
ncbi:MAG: acyl--CoA ligase [Treponema sp.]|nr:acyl--CoA ligase [Treponema sp.]